MAMGNAFITALDNLLYNNTNIANLGDATGVRGSTTAGSIYVALHTADPGAGGDQTSNEATFTNYARQAVARSGTGWTISGQTIVPASNIAFPACGTTGNTITHWSTGVASSGASQMLDYGPLGTLTGPFTAVASTDVITAPDYSSPTNGDQVCFYIVPGESLPTGITAGTIYYVISASGQTFKISTTNGGSAVDITADGGGQVFKLTSKTLTSGDTLTLTTSTQIVRS